jgi:cytochrome c biogenesis protein CcmG/thiol:disulfide interchange protein DsbE
VLTLVIWSLASLAAAAAAPPHIGDPAPAIDLPAIDGARVVRSDDLRGRVTVVEFFATWCQPCARSLDDLRAVRAALGDSVGLLIVAGDADPKLVRAHFAQNPAPAGVVVALDPQRVVAHRWGQDRFPTSYFVDPAGTIRHINRGHGPGFRDRAERWLRAMLAQVPAVRASPQPR